jgi:hypothetical protein
MAEQSSEQSAPVQLVLVLSEHVGAAGEKRRIHASRMPPATRLDDER